MKNFNSRSNLPYKKTNPTSEKVGIKFIQFAITSIVLLYTAFFAIIPLVTFALESFLEISGSYEKFTTSIIYSKVKD